MCSVTIRWLLRFPAFSTLSKHMERQAGESKALAVLHKPAPILGRCHTALCRYHPEEVLILPEKCSYRKTDQRVDDPPEHKCCLVSTCSECPEVPTALEQMHQGKNNIKHLLWLSDKSHLDLHPTPPAMTITSRLASMNITLHEVLVL